MQTPKRPRSGRRRGLAVRHFADRIAPTRSFRLPSDLERAAMLDLRARLAAWDGGLDDEALQSMVFAVGKDHGFRAAARLVQGTLRSPARRPRRPALWWVYRSLRCRGNHHPAGSRLERRIGQLGRQFKAKKPCAVKIARASGAEEHRKTRGLRDRWLWSTGLQDSGSARGWCQERCRRP